CFFNDTATTEIYSLSLHDALPISQGSCIRHGALQPGVSCILLAQARHNLNVESGAVVGFGDGGEVAAGRSQLPFARSRAPAGSCPSLPAAWPPRKSCWAFPDDSQSARR